MRIDTDKLAVLSRKGLLRRDEIFESFFEAEAPRKRVVKCSGALPDASASVSSCMPCSEQVH